MFHHSIARAAKTWLMPVGPITLFVRRKRTSSARKSTPAKGPKADNSGRGQQSSSLLQMNAFPELGKILARRHG
jgi:hypothetical protein